MNIDKINSAPVFSGLNIKKVAKEHRHFIDTNINELKELGEQYDIAMKSIIGSETRCNGIEIFVKNLSKNLGFWQRLNPQKGYSYFYSEPHYTSDFKQTNIVEQTKDAIKNLHEKMAKKVKK